jgi:hypothetical protein
VIGSILTLKNFPAPPSLASNATSANQVIFIAPGPHAMPNKANNVEKVLGIRSQVLKDISQAETTQDWSAVIKKYGTHYVSEVRVGGLVEATYLNDGLCSTVCSNRKAAKPVASLSETFQYLTNAVGSRQFEDNYVAPKVAVSSVGGDPDLGVGCISLEGCTPYNIRSWQSKVFAQSAPYAVVLTPLSLLFSNGIGRLNRCLAIDTALGNAPSAFTNSTCSFYSEIT